MLEYVDSPQTRRNVQKALNRGEQYHHLKRAISHANGGKLHYTTEEEQEIWSETSRLLANILCYTMVLLEEAITAKEAAGDAAGAAFLRSVSPIAWHHINMYGWFAFQDDPAPTPLAECIAALVRYRQQAPADADEAG